MPTYETLLITLPTLTDEEERAIVASMARVVDDGGGVMAANERMGRRRLAYPIRKNEEGVYTRFLYDALPSIPKELDRRLKITDKVLRHMTVRLEEDWAVAAKEQAVRDAQARAEEEAARAAGLLEPATTAATEEEVQTPRRRTASADEDDERGLDEEGEFTDED